MTKIPTFERIEQSLIDRLREIGTATIAGALAKRGIRNPHMVGLTTFSPGASVAGQAVTLQFMPKREDVHWAMNTPPRPSANCIAKPSSPASRAMSSW